MVEGGEGTGWTLALKPATWPEGAKCAVALSFDSDREPSPCAVAKAHQAA